MSASDSSFQPLRLPAIPPLVWRRRGLRSVDISCLPLRTCALVFLLFESDFGLKECASPIELRSLLVRVSD
uniref:Uncharacterized protein n=1 Tax=Physcomitrium patens TaxID=3218 RepID=A0A7I4CNH1_PHYPA